MKILLTTHQFLPEYASGTEILTYSVAKELIYRGHEVTVFTGFPAATQMDDRDRCDTYQIDGIQVVRFHHAFVPMGKQRHVTEIEYCNLLAAQYFKQLVCEIEPDVVHFFHFSRLGAALMDVVFLAGTDAYYTPTDFWAICPTSQLLLEDGSMCPGPTRFGGNCIKHVGQLTRTGNARRIIKLTPSWLAELGARMTVGNILPQYRLNREVTAMSGRKDFVLNRLNALNRIFSPTRLMTDVMLANGVDAARIVGSTYGIDTSYYNQLLRSTSKNQPLTLGFIGTLAAHKGCHILLHAMKLLNDPNIRLRIYGRGTDFPQYYASLCDLAGTDSRIEFCGTFPNSEIGRVLSEIDLLVVPSLWYENTPLVIYSALASGCPVVASDFPGMSEVIVDENNGLLFKPGDVKELHDQLRRFCTEGDLLRSLSSKCRKPKSTQEYVNELLVMYCAGNAVRLNKVSSGIPHGPWLKLDPIKPKRDVGVLMGWATFERSAPTAISLIADDVVVSEVQEFSRRSDVVDGYKRRGLHIKSVLIGFSLDIPLNVQKRGAMIEFTAKSGRVSRVPFDQVESGRSFEFPGELCVGLDFERWPITKADCS